MDINQIVTKALDYYSSINSPYQLIFTLFIFTILIVLYSVLVWNFYRFLAKRDILELDLRQYSKRYSSFTRLMSSLFFLVEYIIITPIVIITWYAMFSVFVLVLSEIDGLSHIVLVSAAIVASIRAASYYNQDLSKDIAKLFPFTLLVIFVTNPGFFSVSKMVTRFQEIPALFNVILTYLIFIVLLEVILRLVFTTRIMLSRKPEDVVKKDEKIKEKG